MKQGIFPALLFALSLCLSCTSDRTGDYLDPELPLDQRVESLLSQMTLEEKVAQAISVSRYEEIIDENDSVLSGRIGELFFHGIGSFAVPGTGHKRDKDGSFEPGVTETVLLNNQLQKGVIAASRLGIPALIIEEGLHGYLAHETTSFPQSIGLASMWDPEMMETIFNAVALEMRSRGVHQALSPVVGLGREPRWGRIEETYGEDPFLVAQCGMAFVNGIQGTGTHYLDHQHIAATLKHYAVHSQPEGGRNCAPGNYSERIIRENFLYPFEMAVKQSRPACVMASYNEVDGIPVHAHHGLLTTILKEEWAFGGYVISDLTGVDQLFTRHFVAQDSAEAAIMAMNAGIDMELPAQITCFHALAEAIRNGQVEEQVLDEAVRRILKVKFQLGLFENPYTDPELAMLAYRESGHQELALKAAHKCMVLLKNELNTLPFDPENISDLAVIGPNAKEIHLGGYSPEPRAGISVLDGIRERGADQFRVHYAEGCRITAGEASFWTDESAAFSDPEEDREKIREAVKVAKKCDAVLLVLGGNETTCREGWSDDHRGDRDNLELIGMQNQLAEAVLATGKPVVVVLINGRPLAVSYLKEKAPAILEAWYAGQETGRAVFDVIFGKVNPGGKLPVTFPVNAGQLPAYYNRKPSMARKYLFGEDEPLFPFGFGLSYTTFSYGGLKVSPRVISAQQQAEVSVEVTNKGTREGDEVVQLYIRDKVSSVTRPVKELKGFQRITLEPGETTTVGFVISPDMLQFYNLSMERVVEPGEFEIMVGTSSTDHTSVTLKVD